METSKPRLSTFNNWAQLVQQIFSTNIGKHNLDITDNIFSIMFEQLN